MNTNTNTNTSDPQVRVKVWDIVVRAFHWSLVVFFFLSYISSEAVDWLHAYLGYAVLILLGVRVLWGLVGTKYARFSNFLYGWQTVRGYAAGLLTGRARRYLGHNPIGGWMIVVLLVCVFLTCWSGLETYAAKGHGPLAQADYGVIRTALAGDGESESGGGGLWKDVHEALASLSVLLILVHVAGVLVASLVHGENLARSMWTGYKLQQQNEETQPPSVSE